MTMKKVIVTLLFASCLSLSAYAQMPVGNAADWEKFQKALEVATDQIQALKAATEFLKSFYGISEKSIIFKQPTDRGSALYVNAKIPGHQCDLTLVRNPDANKFGWIVKEYACLDRK